MSDLARVQRAVMVRHGDHGGGCYGCRTSPLLAQLGAGSPWLAENSVHEIAQRYPRPAPGLLMSCAA